MSDMSKKNSGLKRKGLPFVGGFFDGVGVKFDIKFVLLVAGLMGLSCLLLSPLASRAADGALGAVKGSPAVGKLVQAGSAGGLAGNQDSNTTERPVVVTRVDSDGQIFYAVLPQGTKPSPEALANIADGDWRPLTEPPAESAIAAAEGGSDIPLELGKDQPQQAWWAGGGIYAGAWVGGVGVAVGWGGYGWGGWGYGGAAVGVWGGYGHAAGWWGGYSPYYCPPGGYYPVPYAYHGAGWCGSTSYYCGVWM